MSKIQTKLFGTVNNININEYILTNSSQTSVHIINYGAIITQINTLDKNQTLSNIVLNYETLEEYTQNPSYYGCIVGRCANRIAEGKFTLKGKQYQLNNNTSDGQNHLHGGLIGFNKKVFQVEVIDNENKLVMHYTSVDGEENYPGNLKLRVEYQLNENNEFTMLFECTCDQDTVCNLTSHSYFNLQSEKKLTEAMKDHELVINADYYTPMTNQCIPSGEILSVLDTPFNFQQRKSIQDGLIHMENNNQLKIGNGFDHNYVLNKLKGDLCAVIHEKNSGRNLEIQTNQVGVQLYTGNYLQGDLKRGYFCLETQMFPNSINMSHFPSAILKKNQLYQHFTKYIFSVEK